jgi:hypothetical protein
MNDFFMSQRVVLAHVSYLIASLESYLRFAFNLPVDLSLSDEKLKKKISPMFLERSGDSR